MPSEAETVPPDRVAALLNKAAEFLERPEVWVSDATAKGYLPDAEHRTAMLPTDRRADRFNAVGAIWRMGLNTPVSRAAHEALRRHVAGNHALSIWALQPGRTLSESTTALRDVASIVARA